MQFWFVCHVLAEVHTPRSAARAYTTTLYDIHLHSMWHSPPLFWYALLEEQTSYWKKTPRGNSRPRPMKFWRHTWEMQVLQYPSRVQTFWGKRKLGEGGWKRFSGGRAFRLDTSWEILWKLASALDSWALKPSCNFLRFLAMFPSKTAFFCRKMHFFGRKSVLFCRKVLVFCGKTHFSAVCSGGSRIMSGSLFLDEEIAKFHRLKFIQYRTGVWKCLESLPDPSPSTG